MWQFAMGDVDELSTQSFEEIEMQTPVTVDSNHEVELSADENVQPEFAVELSEFDLQSELSKLKEIELMSDDWAGSEPVDSFETSASVETVDEMATIAAEVNERSIDPFQVEKGILLCEEQPISAWIEELKSGDPAKRAAALQELAQVDENEAFRLITALFDDSSADVRNAAAIALHEFQPDRAASFTRALREGSAERRRNIAAAINGSGLAAQAIDSLEGKGREKTYDAFSILFLMAKAGEVQMLLQTIEKHPDIAVRLSVIRLLTFCNQPDIVQAFRSLAVRGSLPTEVRSALMEAIYQISNNNRENSRSAA
jgi:hypothetical protein